MADGINGIYSQGSVNNLNGEIKKVAEEEESTIDFTESNTNEPNGVEEETCDDCVEISTCPESDEDVDKKNFDVEEAHVYAEGEAAIEREVQLRMALNATKAAVWFGGKLEDMEAKIRDEVRAEYAKNHPEYAAVMEEGQAVEKAHAEAKADAMAEWEENNPKPEKPNALFVGIIGLGAYTIKLQKWEKERAAQEKAFDESYAKENPNYANLKDQQEKYPTPLDILTKGTIGIKTGIIDY